MSICDSCEYYLPDTGHCQHPNGPVYADRAPHCLSYRPKKENKSMNEELRKKYENMSIDDMIEKIEESEKIIEELGARISERHATNREIAKVCVIREEENREKDAKITDLMQQLTDKNVIIKDLNAHNDELLKDFGEAAKEVEEKRTLIIKLENENREKEAKIASLTQEIADSRNRCWSKDSYTKELEDLLDSKSDVVSEQELKIEYLQKKLDSLLEHNKALRFVLRNLYPETYKTWYLGRPMTSEEKEYCDTDIKATKGLSYKCCPEIKKLIDDSKERIEHPEQACRSMETFNLDVSSLYPKKFDLNPNADCPAYAARMKAKYDNLRAVGFTEDQTMSLLPLWIDE